jgi:hypothetical protein
LLIICFLGVFQSSLSTAPLPLGSSISSSGGSKVPLPIIRDKKSGNSYSAAGDDDINDVAAMGGVNLQEEANVSNLVTLLVLAYLPFMQKVNSENSVQASHQGKNTKLL